MRYDEINRGKTERFNNKKKGQLEIKDKAVKQTGKLIFLPCIILFFLASGFFIIHKNGKNDLASYLEKGEVLIDYTSDESFAYALISKQGADGLEDFFVAFEKDSDGWNRTYEKSFKNYKAWKIETADIDGDERKEILTAVRSAAPFDKQVKNRMFIFNYTDGILVKKWTGSQIAGTWRTFYTGDIFSAPGYELLFIECTDENAEKISVYSWFDFGFFKIAESEAYEKIEDLNVAGSNRLEVTYFEKKKKSNHILKAKDGKLVALTLEEPVNNQIATH